MRRAGAAMLLVGALAACAPAPAAPPAKPPSRPQRIVSLDYCADQFVLKLADLDQIAGVSPDATSDFSYMRHAAANAPKVRSTEEEVLARDPDLVVRSYGGGPNVRGLMDRAGVPVAQLGFAQDFDGVRQSIRDMAAAFGHPARGEALIAEMDARLAAVRRDAGDATALYMTPSGVTSGEGSLVHELMTAAGLVNFEQAAGWRPIPLERLAHERPDLIAAAFFGAKTDHNDAWSPARHPVAQRQIAEREAVGLEGAWTSCGGWFLVEAVEALAAGRRAVEARP